MRLPRLFCLLLLALVAGGVSCQQQQQQLDPIKGKDDAVRSRRLRRRSLGHYDPPTEEDVNPGGKGPGRDPTGTYVQGLEDAIHKSMTLSHMIDSIFVTNVVRE